MGLLSYLGLVGIVFVVAVAVRWYEPEAIGRMGRQTQIDDTTAWTILVVATLWLFVPVLAGANVGEGKAWVVGPAIGGVGFYLAVVAVGSIDEYRLLRNTDHVEPREATAGDVVATSGVAEPDGEPARTPVTGVSAVHVDWLIQRRKRLGVRKSWRSLAGGVEDAEFTLGDGAIRVTAGRHRVFTNAETQLSFDPEAELPEGATEFLDSHPDLPAPENREQTLRVTESFVPAEEPVTVIGTARRAETPGTLVVDEAPPDDLLGTDGASEETAPEAVLIRGDVEAATRRLHRRVVWLGIAGAGMILGGQLLAFWLSAATLGALL